MQGGGSAGQSLKAHAKGGGSVHITDKISYDSKLRTEASKLGENQGYTSGGGPQVHGCCHINLTSNMNFRSIAPTTNAPSALSHPATTTLTNPFNDMSLLGAVAKSIESSVTEKIQEERMTFKRPLAMGPGANQRRPGGAPAETSVGQEKPAALSSQAIEKCTFSQHLDVEKVLSIKCTACVCYKMRDKRFLMKRIPKDLIDLQEFLDVYENQNDVIVSIAKNKNRLNNKLIESIDVNFMDPWINLPPGLPL